MILYDFAQNRENRENHENHEHHKKIIYDFYKILNVSGTGPRHEKSQTHKVARTGPQYVNIRVCVFRPMILSDG